MIKQVNLNKKGALQHSDGFLRLCEMAKRDVEEREQNTVLNALENGSICLIDVRDLNELQVQGYIEGAYHLSKGWIEADIHYIASDLSANIVLYCGSGKRSLLAALSLKKMGYQNVSSLKGGFKAWQQHGLPVASIVK